MHLYGSIVGDYRICCHADNVEDKQWLGAAKDKPTEVWNSDGFKQIRLDMLNGKIPKECMNTCYKKEQMGDRSHRMNVNQQYMRYSKLQTLTRKDGSVPYTPTYLDIRFGNLCNLRCRTCGPDASTSWYKDVEGYSKIRDFYTDNDVFWDDLPKIAKTVRDLYFAGGEPFVQTGHYKMLEFFIDRGLSKNINLSYNTNLSYDKFGKYDLEEMWKQFKSVTLWPSVDGFGKQRDYTRKGISWELFETNARKFSDKITNISSVISIFSIMSMPDLILWCKKNSFGYYGTCLINPKHMSLTVLDEKTKKMVNKHYIKFIKENKDKLDAHDLSMIKHWLTYMNARDDSHLAKQFKSFTDRIDKKRNESFVKIYPELAEWYNSI